MNLAAIILQLVSFCSIESNPITCKEFMKECSRKHYNTQQVELTTDYCIKKYLDK